MAGEKSRRQLVPGVSAPADQGLPDSNSAARASAEHFTAGPCTIDGERFEMEGNLTQYVDHRPLFGATRIRGMPIEFSGAIGDSAIDGEAGAVEDSKYSLRFRLNRLPVLN